ncbi:glutathione S-transferase [Pseudoalteromonas sp. SMS1]|uniref:glutathione S-transferase family protein n=1 Tax=Pseudoalteromonas sp. SMS1 TaxID=2908894 RepID=UPI001F286CDE|nr:glutathione S-transferase [Pseudoalteromonas sp. SMS1]MCF2859205.1 glutathione S-transferase [Pseudoalteromonas sp. SMS1]
MIKVHHLNQSRSTRILWLLEELQMEYEVEHHQRDEQTRLAQPSLGQVHSLNKAPIIEHNSLKICESGAIVEYILDHAKHSNLRPEKGTRAYYQYLEWCHFAEGSLALPVIASLLMQMESRDGAQAMDGYIAKELKLDLSFIDATLSEQRYFAGEQFTAADIMMTVILEIALSANLIENRPQISRYLADMQARCAYQRARAYG